MSQSARSRAVCGHREFAGPEHPALAFFRGRTRRADSITEIPHRIARAKRRFVGVDDRLHSQTRENALLEKLEQRHAAHLFGDDAGDDVVGVAVLPLRAGIEVERDLCPTVHDVFRGRRQHHRRHDVVLRPEVLIARRHRQQLAQRDLVGARQIGKPPRDRVVERDLPVFSEQQNRRRRELLADRADAVAHVRRGRDDRVERCAAVGIHIREFPVADDGHRSARRTRGLQDIGGGLVDRVAKILGKRVLPGCWRRQRENGEHGAQGAAARRHLRSRSWAGFCFEMRSSCASVKPRARNASRKSPRPSGGRALPRWPRSDDRMHDSMPTCRIAAV